MSAKTRISTSKSKSSPNNRVKKQGRLPQASSVTASATSSLPSAQENDRSSPTPSNASDGSGMDNICLTTVIPPQLATQADESSESSSDAEALAGTAKRLSFAHLLQDSAPSRPTARPSPPARLSGSALPPKGVSFDSSKPPVAPPPLWKRFALM